MKTGVHPTYYPQAKVKCACGKTWTTGSTQPELLVEICSNCHPFYSGKEKILDTRGRVEKFKKRLEKSSRFSPNKNLVRKSRILDSDKPESGQKKSLKKK